MSYLDVYVLRNFTRKLAYSPTSTDIDPPAAKPAPRRPFDETPAETAERTARQTAKAVPAKSGLVPNVIKPSKPYSSPPAAPAPTGSVADAARNADGRAYQAGADAAGAAQQAGISLADKAQQAGAALADKAQQAGGAIKNTAGGMLDSVSPYLLPAGLTAAGGLGAMSLARMFNSKKDEEDEGSVMPWLAGAGGAAGGYALSQYMPQILAALGVGGSSGSAPVIGENDMRLNPKMPTSFKPLNGNTPDSLVLPGVND